MVLSLFFCCKIHPLDYRIRVGRIVREREREREEERESEREFRHTDRKERREGGIGRNGYGGMWHPHERQSSMAKKP